MRQEDKNHEARITAQPIAVTEGKEKGKLVYKIRGYAALFGNEYDMGWYTESLSPDAFKGADMKDIRCLFNHDPSLILGRTKAGTCMVGIDRNGLFFECTLPDSPIGTNARVAIERGDITQCSWSFMMPDPSKGSDGSIWIKQDAKNGRTKPHRILAQVKAVGDVSPVTYPANPETMLSISASAERSYKSATGAMPPAATFDQAAPGSSQPRWGPKFARELELLKIENDILGERLAYEKLAAENETQRKKRQAIDFCYSIGINPKGKF